MANRKNSTRITCKRTAVKHKQAVGLWIALIILTLALMFFACSEGTQRSPASQEVNSTNTPEMTSVLNSPITIISPPIQRTENAKTEKTLDSVSTSVSLTIPNDHQQDTKPLTEEKISTKNTKAEKALDPVSTSVPLTILNDNEQDAKPLAEEEISLEVESEPALSYLPESGPLSLDERILRSDLIIRATLASISTSTPYTYRYDPPWATSTDYYLSTLELRFKIHEYLKGSGGDTLVVDLLLSEDDYYMSISEAVAATAVWLPGRDTRWDDREAIIFLQKPVGSKVASTQSNSSRYVFPIHEQGIGVSRDVGTAYAVHDIYVDTYSIRSEKNRAWLPATSAPTSGASGLSEARYYLEEPPSPSAGASGQSADISSISLSNMKSRVQAIDDLLEQSVNKKEYRKCLTEKYALERELDHQGLTGTGPYFDRDLYSASGLPVGSVLNNGRIFGGEEGQSYSKFFFTGPDAGLFSKEIEDNDNDKANYSVVSKINRPLPRGTYELYNNAQHWLFLPCDYVPKPYLRWYVHVTAPRGTLHEAFFDPVVNTSTSAVGADGSLGALKPTDFRVTGYSGFRRVTSTTTVKGLYWENNKIRMEFAGSAPRTELSGSFMDVIGLDGKVSLTLDFNKSALSSDGKSLSWDAGKQPWKAGDKLMLRIREGMAGIGGESREPGTGSGR